jgi:hypothetical protein
MAYTHKQPTDFEREYILGPDGVFYSREVITTPIVNQHKLVERCKFADELLIQNNRNRFSIEDTDVTKQIKSTYSYGYYEGFYKTSDQQKHIFVPLMSFPFPKAKIHKYSADGEPELYRLYPNGNSPVTQSNVINTPMTPYYFSRFIDMYVFFTLTQQPYSDARNTYRVSEPYLFGVTKESKEPVVINLPNVFETGKICTGDSFGDVGGLNHTREVVTKVITELTTSPANWDLYPPDSQFTKHLMYNEMGVLQEPDAKYNVIKENGFFSPCTRSQVVDFCKSAVIRQ